MKRYSTNQLRIIAVSFVVILLLAGVVAFTGHITHTPQALWKRITYIAHPPPPTPTVSQKFTTLPPGAALPSEQECAARVRRSSWEPRPDNYTANHHVPTVQQIAGLGAWGPPLGMALNSDTLRLRITGNFTGTTDEILQWAACKWGIDEDIIRAEAVQESDWNQSQLGDSTDNQHLCPPDTWNGSSCYQSYGILQMKYSDYPGAWPMSRDDTAFNVDYTYGYIRNCYEGWLTYLNNNTPVPGYVHYAAGDLWGCLGQWYSGGWYDQGAINYINSIKTQLTNKEWLQPGF